MLMASGAFSSPSTMVSRSFELAEHFPLTQLRRRFHEARSVVQDDEALDAEAPHQNVAKTDEARIFLGVAGDESAENHAAVKIHAVQDFLHDFSADIFKIDVDAVGSGGSEFFFPVCMFVVDGGVETEILGDPRAFVVSARNANDAAAVNLSNLPGDASGGPGRGGDDKRFAFFGRCDFHAEKSSKAVEAEHAEENRVRNKRNLRDFLEELLRGHVDDDIVLQTSKARDAVAFFVIGVARLDDFGETGRPHDFTDRHNRKVGIRNHPDAHSGIDGKIFHAREGLAVFYFWHWRFG